MLNLAHRAYRAGQVNDAGFVYTPPALAEGHVLAVGAHGDHDLGTVFERLLLRHRADGGVRFGRTLSDALAGTSQLELLADERLPVEGKWDAIYFYNPQGSGGAASFDVQGVQLPLRNSGEQGHPGNGEFVVRATPVANDTVEFVVTARYPITLTYAKTWTKVPASGAACTMAIAAPLGNVLSAMTVNVAALTTVTFQTQALTATVARLDLDPGQSVTITIVGGPGLTPGDLLVALGWVLR